eukprot:1884020-Rhodomonas_salina.1
MDLIWPREGDVLASEEVHVRFHFSDPSIPLDEQTFVIAVWPDPPAKSNTTNHIAGTNCTENAVSCIGVCSVHGSTRDSAPYQPVAWEIPSSQRAATRALLPAPLTWLPHDDHISRDHLRDVTDVGGMGGPSHAPCSCHARASRARRWLSFRREPGPGCVAVGGSPRE